MGGVLLFFPQEHTTHTEQRTTLSKVCSMDSLTAGPTYSGTNIPRG